MKRIFWLSILCLMPLSAQASPHDVYGLWVSEAKDGHIEISDCGDGTPCGKLVWIDPAKADTALDLRNKDAGLRARPLLDVPIIWDFKRAKKGWKAGKIYNPEDGKTFRARVKAKDADHLQVKGCLGLICIANIWTRVAPQNQITLNN
ncbi:MAG: DUF2147 domain-containing protein [Maricaulaceae bacterium]